MEINEICEIATELLEIKDEIKPQIVKISEAVIELAKEAKPILDGIIVAQVYAATNMAAEFQQKGFTREEAIDLTKSCLAAAKQIKK